MWRGLTQVLRFLLIFFGGRCVFLLGLNRYHGWPGDLATGEDGLCAHRRESFPGWHRAYMMEVENALRAADIELGNDGRIGFPYVEFVTVVV